MLTEIEIKELKEAATEVRRNIVKMVHNSKSGHPGGSLSGADILTVLYKKSLNIPLEWDKSADFENRDRFILSKGHASPLLYSILAMKGIIPKEELMTFRKFHSKLQGHPAKHYLSGIETSTGSLGQGLSAANGMALAGKLDNKNYRVYCVLGDGEIEEGQVWEAAMSASHYKLDNLCVIVDNNNLQIDGTVDKVMSPYPIVDKFESFGFNVIQIDGHDYKQIIEAFENAKKVTGKPTAIIAKTIKGKGVSYMENQASWHGKAPNEQELAQAMQELI